MPTFILLGGGYINLSRIIYAKVVRDADGKLTSASIKIDGWDSDNGILNLTGDEAHKAVDALAGCA